MADAQTPDPSSAPKEGGAPEDKSSSEPKKDGGTEDKPRTASPNGGAAEIKPASAPQGDAPPSAPAGATGGKPEGKAAPKKEAKPLDSSPSQSKLKAAGSPSPGS